MDAFPKMLTLARSARGLSQSALAKKMGTSQPKVSALESGDAPLDGDYLCKASEALGFPESFFRTPPPKHATDTSPFHHRKLQSVGATRLGQIHANLRVIQLHLERLIEAEDEDSQRFEGFRNFDPDEYRGGAKEVAETVRSFWGIAPGPIQNLTEAVETAGAIVLMCDFGSTRVEGLSRYIPDLPPMIFVNQEAPGDRQRWTVAHEAGHLAMHIDRTPHPDLEKQADQFASEFLMPARQIRRDFVGGVDLHRLAALKRKWGVSMQALIMRARNLDIITDSQKKSLFVRLSQRGWRTREPGYIKPEEPRRLRTIIDRLRSEHGLSLEEIATRLSSSHKDFVASYFPDRRGLRLVK